jgi:hypothetical protein
VLRVNCFQARISSLPLHYLCASPDPCQAPALTRIFFVHTKLLNFNFNTRKQMNIQNICYTFLIPSYQTISCFPRSVGWSWHALRACHPTPSTASAPPRLSPSFAVILQLLSKKYSRGHYAALSTILLPRPSRYASCNANNRHIQQIKMCPRPPFIISISSRESCMQENMKVSLRLRPAAVMLRTKRLVVTHRRACLIRISSHIESRTCCVTALLGTV